MCETHPDSPKKTVIKSDLVLVSTSVETENIDSKNVENKSEGEGKDIRVRVREISTSKNCHSPHFHFRPK